ncbi:MAG: PBP1A family penicillin-binding protein [Chloroflexi bacterium]|nr:PBP1A family penicillin-binding protein [Chloroflexota bacterium]
MNPTGLTPGGLRLPESDTRRGLRLLLLVTAGLALGALIGVLLFVAVYARFAASLPPADELRQRSATFRSTRIYDRDGRLLNETFDPDAGRRTVVPLDRISPYLVQATIATEDANFYQHAGVDPVAILRAFWYALREHELVSGGSTIPQQLVKRVFLSPERTVSRKLKEAVLAAEITRRYTKDEILELYLNEIFYGSFAYGIESASQTFFGKPAADLNLAEASLLAGLPQAPAWYDPYTNPEAAEERQTVVLALMVEAGYVTREAALEAVVAPLDFQPLRLDLVAPHFSLYVRQQVEAITGDPAALYTRGLHVTTSLDRELQAEAERIVAEQIDALADRNVGNAALLAMQPETGEILAFVGSKDFNDEAIAGQINMALSPRQPGSALKPFVYLTAFEKDPARTEDPWTPGTLIPDIRTEFPDGANPPYVPVNYDGKEHGFVTARAALANSYNIPAVATLQYVGLPAFIETLQRLGVSTLDRPDYGLSLALGGGELPLIELTSAYAALASGGRLTPPVAILAIKDQTGEIICQAGDPDRPCLPIGTERAAVERRQVIDPEDAFLVTDMLSDNAARLPAFGPASALELDRPAAVKTGTTNDYRDNWTMGYTPQIVTGVWVGNADNSEMQGTTGLTGAAPIWNAFMHAAHAGIEATAFAPPDGVTGYEICADTGTQPSEVCPALARWYFAKRRPPLPAERDLWQRLRIDTTTGRLASRFTPDSLVEARTYKVYPLAEGDPNPYRWRDWAEANGIPQPPRDQSETFDYAPRAEITFPEDGATVSGLVEVLGTAKVPGQARYELSWAESGSDDFQIVKKREPGEVEDGSLGSWDTSGLNFGWHRLRLVVYDLLGERFESSIMVRVENLTPTPSPSAAAATPTATETAPVTPTPSASPTPAPTSAATAKPSAAPATLAPRPTVPRPPVGPPTSGAPPTLPPPPTEPPTEPPAEPTSTAEPIEPPATATEAAP